MNSQLKTILLTVLTLSLLTIALVELSGVSKTALFNKYAIGEAGHRHDHSDDPDRQARLEEARSLPKTQILFGEPHHDFGVLKEGARVRHIFSFKNTGEHPLLISDVRASCGCTVPRYSKNPVAPGESGTIEVEFNTTNQKGKNNKNIIVLSNAERDRVSIGFSAVVE